MLSSAVLQDQLIGKAQSSERQRLDALLTRQEARLRRAFMIFLITARAASTLREMRSLLRASRIPAVLELLDPFIVKLSNVLPQMFIDVANSEANVAKVTKARIPSVGFSFDPTNRRAAELMRTSKLNFISEFSKSQREAVSSTLSTSLIGDTGARQAARAFRDSIGLTEYQLGIVDNYRNLLETGSAEALARDLRDRRYDSTVARMFENGEPLDSDQIDRMVDRYRERLLALRADTIARTESLRVMSQARQEALEQAVEDVGADRSQVRRTWRASRDKRTRDTHREMDGQEVGIDEPFESPSGAFLRYPGDPRAPAGETINCRCVVTHEI